jgi:hypothetical protein
MQNQGLSTDEISRVSQAAKVELPVKSQVKGVKTGQTQQGPEGNDYEWKGAQWVNKDTGRVAKKQVAQQLTKSAKDSSQAKSSSAAGSDNQERTSSGVDIDALAKEIKKRGLSDQVKKLL